MQITKITTVNKKAFESFLPKNDSLIIQPQIRIGVTDGKGNAVGALCAVTDQFYTEIVSIYVLPDKRRQGYGRAMFNTLTRLIKDSRSETLTAEFLDDGSNSYFFRTMGFEMFESKIQYSFSLKEFLRSPLYKRFIKGKNIKEATLISDLDLIGSKKVSLETGNPSYDPEWSTVYSKNGKYLSFLLASRYDKDICIVWMENLEQNNVNLMYNISGLFHQTVRTFGEDADITYRMTFNDDKLVANMTALIGGKYHLHKDGRLLTAVR